FFFQAGDGIRDRNVTGVQTCALPILLPATEQLIGVEGEALEDGLEALLERGEVVQETVAGEEAVYLHDLYEAEQYVAFRLSEMRSEERRVGKEGGCGRGECR